MAKKTSSLFMGFWLLFSILACPAQAQAKPKKKTFTLQGLIEKALAEGYETYLPDIMGSLIDLPGDVAVQLFDVPLASSTDNMVHVFKVIVEESTSTKNLTPLKLLFDTAEICPTHDEDYLFKSNLDGSLEKAIVISGKRTPDGKVVKGSGVVSEKDIDSPEIQERFQHELDFWLKGKYRKPKAGKN